jgi:hypothetical protein
MTMAAHRGRWSDWVWNSGAQTGVNSSVIVMSGAVRENLFQMSVPEAGSGNPALPSDRPHPAIGSVLNKPRFASLAVQRFDSQNVNVSSSAIKMTGGPPDEIFTALAKVCLPPADSAHAWSASMDGKCTSATR